MKINTNKQIDRIQNESPKFRVNSTHTGLSSPLGLEETADLLKGLQNTTCKKGVTDLSTKMNACLRLFDL